MLDLIAPTKSGNYQVLIESGALNVTGAIAAGVCQGKRACIVSDHTVMPLYGERVQNSLAAAGFTTTSALIPPGEGSKSVEQLIFLYEQFHQAAITRADLIVSLGGGVVGDLAGFAAATWLRGVSLIHVPTTLLAQVDSSIGGKTAIDLPFGKNLAGAFYQPKAVIMDPSVLASLSDKQMSDGLAEVIKYGLIRDRELFKQLESKNYDLEWVIERCVKIKIDIVAKDELDSGERMLLNFGHTLGHAIEKISNFSTYTHGQSVAVGMVIAAKIGERLGDTPAGTTAKIISLLEKYDLPTTVSLPLADILPALSADKKNMGPRLYFVLLKEIGSSFLRAMHKEGLEALLEEVW